jgi:hypothetical protein
MTANEAKARYRHLKAQQRAMPVEDQWRLGPALKEAKAAAYIEIEYERLGLQ